MSIFEGFLSTPETLAAFSDHNFVDAMLRFEAALARAQAAERLIPESAAHSIVGSCKVELFDVAKIVRDSGRAGSVAIPLVKSLKEAVGLFNADAVPFVHFGSTSQDVIDSAMSLVTREAMALIEADLGQAAQALAAACRDSMPRTPMLARTLMQPASVTSFGFKCAGWAAPLVRAGLRLRAGRAARSAAAAGRRRRHAGTDEGRWARPCAGAWRPSSALPTRRHLAHAARRVGVARLRAGLMVGSLGKIARDIALMGQYEVGELSEPSEPGRGGSSAMPHKKNPVASMVALAAAQRAPQRVAALLGAMPQEHERALGAWQAELAEWPQLLMCAHGSVRAMAGALPGLRVDAARMRSNIDRLRAELPREAADEWFDPALAEGAGALALAQAGALQAQLEPTTAR